MRRVYVAFRPILSHDCCASVAPESGFFQMAKGTLRSIRNKISRRTVEALQPGERLTDTEIKGFVVRCFTDRKVYSLKLFVTGRQRTMTIGTDGIITPDAARRKAIELRGMAAAGHDPATDREVRQQKLTIGEVVRRFLAEHCGLIDTTDLRARFAVKPGAPVKHGTAQGYRDSLRDHVLPILSNRTIDSVDAADIATIHHRMQSTPTAANTMLSVMSVLHSWSHNRKLRSNPENPTTGIKRYPSRRRTRFLSLEETKRMAEAILAAEHGVPMEQVPRYSARRAKERARSATRSDLRPGPKAAATASITIYSAAALRFLLLTGLRPQEALDLRWSDIDLATGYTRLPDTKTGPREATLSSHAIELIKTIPALKGNPYVFCGAKTGKPLSSLQHAFDLVAEIAGLDDDVVLYTLRHNYGSTLAAQRVEAYEIMKAMGHRNLSTSLRYIHLAQQGVQAITTKATAGIASTLTNAAKGRADVDDDAHSS
jgi:integrase